MPRHSGDGRQLEIPALPHIKFTDVRSHQASWRTQPRNSRVAPPSSERLAATHRRTRFRHPSSGVLRLNETRCGSPKVHYVNHSVRGFGRPGSRRISSACFRPSRLRMRRIIRPQVVAPASHSAPVATHSVATIAHLAFSLAGTILIPDCAPPQRLSPAFFPKLPPAPIYSSGRSRP